MESDLRKIYLSHFGTIFFRMSIVLVIVCASILAIPFLWVGTFFVAIAIVVIPVILSVGMILMNEGFYSFSSTVFGTLLSDGIKDFVSEAVSYFPIVATITGIIIGLSALFLAFDLKNKSSKTKFIISCVLFLVFIIVVIIFACGGGIA